jgi:hypothetical protein
MIQQGGVSIKREKGGVSGTRRWLPCPCAGKYLVAQKGKKKLT